MNNLDLLHFQHDFVTSNAANLTAICGVGTGKTTNMGCPFVLRMIAEFPKTDGMIVANTYSQLINSVVTPLTKLLSELKIPHHTSYGVRHTLTVLNTTIYLYSLEKPENTKGLEVGWIWADEFFLNKTKKPYDIIKTRLRCPDGPLFFRGTTTKNGFNWGYYMYSAPDRKNSYQSIEATSQDNPFLPDQYLPDLLEDYGSVDAPMYRQEVLNEYVNMTCGSVYYSFNRDKHVKACPLRPNHHIYTGVDFNIDFLNGVYVQYINGIFYVGKELHLAERNANTFDLGDRIVGDLFKFPFKSVVPDSTGKARKSSSEKSDHQILRDKGLHVEPSFNPRIKDRQNAVNRAFNLNKLFIDPSCTKLITELETIATRDDEGKVSHIAVALGYVIWKLSPIRKDRNESSYTIQR